MTDSNGGAATFYAVCIIAPADTIQEARQGAWEFHKQDSKWFDEQVDRMLPKALSPTGAEPATHFLCTRHDTREHFDRIEAYQRTLVAAGRPRVPVTLYVSDHTVEANGDTLPAALAAFESGVLQTLGLKRVADA